KADAAQLAAHYAGVQDLAAFRLQVTRGGDATVEARDCWTDNDGGVGQGRQRKLKLVRIPVGRALDFEAARPSRARALLWMLESSWREACDRAVPDLDVNRPGSPSVAIFHAVA